MASSEPGSASLTFVDHHYDELGYSVFMMRGEREDGQPWIGEIVLPSNGLELLSVVLTSVIQRRTGPTQVAGT